MQQVWVIHGGDTYNTYEDYLTSLNNFAVNFTDLTQKNWKQRLGDALGDDFSVLAPTMPNKYNAKYLEWKIWFKKYLPFIAEDAIVVGHSLGGLFVLKFLAEEAPPVSLRAIFLLAAPYAASPPESLADFTVPSSLERLHTLTKKIYLYHSQDDPVVPFQDFQQYAAALPTAETRIFTDRQHFNQPDFPELVNDIRTCRL